MKTQRIQHGVRSLREHGARNAAFYLFCAFIISYFGRLAKRVPLLGAMHFDLVLAVLALLAIVFAPPKTRAPRARNEMDPVAKRLCILLAYI
ncbi:MAG TPA: hypothetical protein VGP20_02545, partial [Steroidobacteraceae bacterium]|nr:hypothetical protein [Steroidobacteraceae bacterium]